MRLLSLLSLSLLLACDPTPPTVERDGGTDDASIGGDTDGDGISDEDEGRRDAVDTDGDGQPDYLDDDSDGDGVPDSVEAGDESIATPPRDSDTDGVPDFRDDDSDNNGILDRDELLADTDGDGRLDGYDLDDDGDQASDIIELGRGGPTVDTDGDGIVDFKDPDSDDDLILDGHELTGDTDMDGLDDWQDLDSDADGYPDEEEAGDTDIFTVPVDTDMDGIPDFRDPDSDNDGISDLDERAAGTSRTSGDTDMDGVSDLIEIGAGTDPLDPTDNPRARGDFVFVVPFGEPPTPERDTLVFQTNIQIADVYFLMDTTGSMGGEIAAMRAAVRDIVTNITCEDFGTACTDDDACAAGQICSLEGRCIADPVTSACIASVYTGVGTYEGNPNSYRNRLSLQGDSAMTQTRIPTSANGGGASESLFESVACVADPMVCAGAGCDGTGTGIGCPGYRMDAVRILVTVTDEPNQCDSSSCSANTAMAAGMRLASAGITFVGVDADFRNTPRTHLTAIATQSGSFDSTGAPLVYDGDGAAVTAAVTAAINEIVNGVPLRVTIEAADEPDDDGDALPFIDFLEVNVSGTGECTMVTPTEDTDADGHDDAFPELLPGTSVCWDVVPITNDIVMPELRPLVFRARLTVRGDGSPLDDRVVYFLVPPRIEVPMGPG